MRSVVTISIILKCLSLPCFSAHDEGTLQARALNAACVEGKNDVVKKLLAAGADPNGPSDVYRRSPLPLHEAIENHHAETVKLLVQAGAKLNDPKNLALVTAIGWFSRYDDEVAKRKMIDLLLGLGADVHAGDEAAVNAAAGAGLGLLKHIIKAGGVPSFETLSRAVNANQLEAVNFLIEAGIDPKRRDDKGGTLLHQAATSWTGSNDRRIEDLWDRLLAVGVEIDAGDNDGDTALHLAARRLYVPMVNWLIDHHAMVKVANQKGRTPLADLAASEEDSRTQEILARLLAAGARIDARDQSDRTPLDHAVAIKNWSGVRALLEAGATPTDALGVLLTFARATLDHPTSLVNASALVRLLVPKVHDLVRATVDGMPLLSWTVLINHQAAAQYLIDAGVDINAADAEGRTALMMAALTGNAEMTEFLKLAGADVSKKDRQGRDAGALAAAVSRDDGTADDSAEPSQVTASDDLFSAIASHKVADVKRIIEAKGFAVDEMRCGVLPLHLAVSLGFRDVVELLLAHGGSATTTTSEGSAPVVVALQSGQLELARWLLSNAANDARATMIRALTGYFKKAPHSYQALKLVADKDLPSVLKDGTGELALTIAIQADDLALAKQLIEQGVSLKATAIIGRDPFGVISAGGDLLRLAAQASSPKLLKYLLEKTESERPAWKTEIDQTLLYVCSAGDLPVVRLLVESAAADVNMNSADFAGVGGGVIYSSDFMKLPFTPLCQAVEQGHSKVVAYLLDKGAKVMGRDRSTRQVLASAVVTGNVTLVQSMLAHGADLEAADRDGRTALHEAAIRGYHKIGRLLIAKGANQAAKDKDGFTPAQLAEREGFLPP